MTPDVAALYIDPRGPYPSMPGVDCWDEARDARLYDGPHPVVAHSPCERWGRYWSGGPSAKVRRKLGDDGGCFRSALASVNRWGGVLEHPEASHAFLFHGLRPPRWREGWRSTSNGYACCVSQGHYGHRARKLTWLYAAGMSRCDLPEFDWSIPEPRPRLDYGFHSAAERAERYAEVSTRVNATRLTTAENLATPKAFAEWLVTIARSVSAARKGVGA